MNAVPYFERETGTWLDVAQPETIDDALDIVADSERYAQEDRRKWKAHLRMYTATSLYVLGLMCSCGARLDPYTGRPEILNDWLFRYAQEVQADSDSVVDFTARRHWKSTWKTHLKAIQALFVDPNENIGLFSHELPAAVKHLIRNRDEMENNETLKAVWDDVLFASPGDEARQWSLDNGLVVKRTINSQSPSMAAYTFMKKLPTGSRLGILIFDDCETEATVSNEKMRTKCIKTFRSALNLRGRAGRVWINGTFHHPAGLINTLIKEGWKQRCHKAEDVIQPAPEIPETSPITGQPLEERVRTQKLAGAPILLHPVECAEERANAKNSGDYEMQMMGDPHSGQERKMQRSWVRRYTRDPQTWSDEKNLYIMVDPSKGKGDPTVALVFAASKDQKLSLVDGLRRKMGPSEFNQELSRLMLKWSSRGRLMQVRIEEFAQAQYAHYFQKHMEDHYGYCPAPVLGCGSNALNSTESGRLRDWNRLEPAFKFGTLLLPPEGSLWEVDGAGRMYDLVEYFLENEYDSFPLCLTDDILACFALLFEPEDKVGPIQWPDGSEGSEDGPGSDGDGSGDNAWMTEGF